MSEPVKQASRDVSSSRTEPVPGELSAHFDRFRVFIQDIGEGIYETDLRGTFTFYNKALCRLFGCSPSEMRERHFREFMDEEHARKVTEHINEIYRTGRELSDLVWRITRKDGEERIIELSASLIYDERGVKQGFRGIARDITEKHYARLALKQSEERYQAQYEASRRAEKRYRTLLEFLPDPMVVLNMDGMVVYVNPAFVEVFGWTLDELEGKRIPFVPDELTEITRLDSERFLREKIVHGYETRRLTKDGRVMEVVIGAALFYEEDERPAGQLAILNDVTQERRTARTNEALLRVSTALHEFRTLEEVLEVIVKQVQELVDVEGASVILLDEERGEFFFPVAAYDDPITGKKMREIRFPADKGVAGEVLRTGKPLIVPDTSKSPHFYQQVDVQSEYVTHSMLDVPIATPERIIGVLCAVNKREGDFDKTDADTLSAIASTVALPIVNARMNEELAKSYREVQSLNRAKDRVIHHLSHELKTPLSVLAGTFRILSKKMGSATEQDPGLARTFQRAERNLGRLLRMQYGIEDILKDRSYEVHHLLSALLETCSDELETLVAEETGDEEVLERIRNKLDLLFGPGRHEIEEIDLSSFVRERIEALRPLFAHRSIRLEERFDSNRRISIPREPLSVVVDGLVRNAVENTPDEGLVRVGVWEEEGGTVLEVKDYGVGITEESRRSLFKGVFTTRDTEGYSSKSPFDFNAGGKGIDLFRMKIFSEYYGFDIRMDSETVPFSARGSGPLSRKYLRVFALSE
jgi:PAS domain S-box-containing protein